MHDMAAFTAQRHALRRELQAKRRAISIAEQQQAAAELAQRVMALPVIAQAQTVAIYFSVGHEIDTSQLISALWHAGKQVALPVLHPVNKGQLLFLHYHPDTEMQANPLGIPEPRLDVQQVIPLEQLDVMLIPLVGFDRQGQRLGMGGGYYDRTLSRWAAGQLPNLNVIGLAHDCQQVSDIPAAAWDVPMTNIVTPSKHWQFGNTADRRTADHPNKQQATNSNASKTN